MVEGTARTPYDTRLGRVKNGWSRGRFGGGRVGMVWAVTTECRRWVWSVRGCAGGGLMCADEYKMESYCVGVHARYIY